MNEEDDILIQDFLRGDLPPKEKKRFEERIKTDPMFRDKFNFERQLFLNFNQE